MSFSFRTSLKRSIHAACVVVIAIAAIAPTRAHAQEPQPPAATVVAPRRVVSVAITGGGGGGGVAGADQGRVLEDTIRELLARLQLTMVPKGGAAASSLLATVEVDLPSAASATTGAHVVVRSASGVTVIDRTIAPDANAAIQREQIAHAVRGAAEAELLADEDRVAGRAPAVAPPVTPTEPPAPPPPAAIAKPNATVPAEPPVVASETPPAPASSGSIANAFALDVATVAGVGLFADDVDPLGRVGGSAILAYRRGVHPSLAIGALYAFPVETENNSTLATRTSVVSFRAMPSIEAFRRSRFALEVGAGAGFDVIRVDPSSDVLPASALARHTTRIDPIITTSVTGRLALASDVVLTLSAVADIDLTTRRYVFEDRGQTGDVLAPWTLRPMLLLGLSFTAAGEPPFGSFGKTPPPKREARSAKR